MCADVQVTVVENSSAQISWLKLIAGAIVTLGLALSVHAVMIQLLHIPFPYNFPHAGWARLPDSILSVFGAIYLSRHLPAGTRARSLAYRSGLLFLLLAAIHEVLFRAPFMEFINLSNFTLYPFIDNIPHLIPLAAIAVGVEVWTRRRYGLAVDIAAAGILAALATMLIAPIAMHAFADVLRTTAAREGVQRYGLPYDWHILLPAYLTFLEPVVASLVIGRAVRDQLPTRAGLRFAITLALLLALKGPVFAPFLNIHFAGTDPLLAMLSYAQFSFETIALGGLTAANLLFSTRRVE